MKAPYSFSDFIISFLNMVVFGIFPICFRNTLYRNFHPFVENCRIKPVVFPLKLKYNNSSFNMERKLIRKERDKVMRKKRAITSMLLAAVLLLGGCGNGAQQTAEGSEPESGAVSEEGTVEENDSAGKDGQNADGKNFSEAATVTFFSTETDAALAALTTLIDNFNAENEYNITVEISTPSDYETLMKTRMASNNLPDIFGTHGWAVRRYDEYLYDLSGESWAGSVDDGIRNIITDESGKLCALPLGQAIEGIQFNKDVLDTYGINPLELDTWDKFVAALEKIRDESNGEVAPMFLAGSEVGITGFFTNSLCAVNVGGNEAAGANALLHGEEFDWKYVAQVMQAYKDLADNELFNDGYMTAQVPDMIEAIATGKCAFIFLGTQVMEGASAANPDLNWGFMPYPAMSDLGATEPAFVNGEQGTYGIWKDSPNLEVARKVLEYLAQPENIAYYCNNSGKPAGIDGVELELAEKNEYYGIFTDVKAVGQFDRTYLPNGLFDVMGDAQAKVLMGSIDAEEGAKMMQEEYDRLFGKAE